MGQRHTIVMNEIQDVHLGCCLPTIIKYTKITLHYLRCKRDHLLVYFLSPNCEMHCGAEQERPVRHSTSTKFTNILNQTIAPVKKWRCSRFNVDRRLLSVTKLCIGRRCTVSQVASCAGLPRWKQQGCVSRANSLTVMEIENIPKFEELCLQDFVISWVLYWTIWFN